MHTVVFNLQCAAAKLTPVNGEQYVRVAVNGERDREYICERQSVAGKLAVDLFTLILLTDSTAEARSVSKIFSGKRSRLR